MPALGPIVSQVLNANSVITSAGSIPAGALAAGYTARTFGPVPVLGGNLLNFNFFSTNAAGTNTQNPDGTLTCVGNPGNGYGVCSAHQNNAFTNNWQGVAFGGGAYFECVLKFPPVNGSLVGLGWPSFWLMNIEHLSGVLSWMQWPGQATGYYHWVEIDIFEFDAGVTNKYGIAGHDWYEDTTPTVHNVSTGGGGFSPITVAADMSQYHAYGLAWIPATATNQGSAIWYFDNVAVGTINWNAFTPQNNNVPPPVSGSTMLNIIDAKRVCPIIGSTHPTVSMTVLSCSVWQKSSAKNLMQ